MHNEATKLRRVFVPAGVRECKEQTAPGEVPSKLLSDRGSTPLGSTKQVKGEPISFGRWIRLYCLPLIYYLSILSFFLDYDNCNNTAKRDNSYYNDDPQQDRAIPRIGLICEYSRCGCICIFSGTNRFFLSKRTILLSICSSIVLIRSYKACLFTEKPP